MGEAQHKQVQNGEQWSLSFWCWLEDVLGISTFCNLLSFGKSTQGMAVSTNT